MSNRSTSSFDGVRPILAEAVDIKAVGNHMTGFKTFFRSDVSRIQKYDHLVEVIEAETDDSRKQVLRAIFYDVKNLVREWDRVVAPAAAPAPAPDKDQLVF